MPGIQAWRCVCWSIYPCRWQSRCPWAALVPVLNEGVGQVQMSGLKDQRELPTPPSLLVQGHSPWPGSGILGQPSLLE